MARCWLKCSHPSTNDKRTDGSTNECATIEKALERAVMRWQEEPVCFLCVERVIAVVLLRVVCESPMLVVAERFILETSINLSRL